MPAPCWVKKRLVDFVVKFTKSEGRGGGIEGSSNTKNDVDNE